MNPVKRTMRLFAGSMVTISLTLGYFISPFWYLLTLFVGLNMMQSAFSRWCFAENMIKKYNLGFRKE
ncbi:DUF2892 domain-containing protein [Rhodohalobacter sp.]|uniref:YgaP family membrane protein n=1 Tax=Rhodohalobacter sp. TaxID=1974210 RepID=UPI002ACE6A4C|nr:DUF2892 domain-containing protein [Rhodohalobacter sp.]MDZ7757315.1 DUF2892 domain-containing protein [Rhodohalobacter sp.]